MTEIADRVRQLIADHFKSRNIDPSQVVPKAHLVEDLGADSLDLLDIVFALEDRFGQDISETEVKKVATVKDLIVLIERETIES